MRTERYNPEPSATSQLLGPFLGLSRPAAHYTYTPSALVTAAWFQAARLAGLGLGWARLVGREQNRALASDMVGEGCQLHTLYPEWFTARGRPDSPDIFVRGGLGAVCGSNARRQVSVSAPFNAPDIHKVPGGGR